MDIRHYEIDQKSHLAWYGFLRIGCPDKVKQELRKESDIAHLKGFISERELEVDCFLSIMAEIKRDKVYLIECGAGWGEWCMALAGVMQNNLIKTRAKTYEAYGIEGDDYFYKYMQRNFKYNNIIGSPIKAGVSDHNGSAFFNTGFISRNHCGGNLSTGGTFKGSLVAGKFLTIANRFAKTVERVPVFNLDTFIQLFGIPHGDILHIDVQGSETLVLKGAVNNLANIDYMIIGTHGARLHRKVKEMLADTHDIVVEALPARVTRVNGLLPSVLISRGQDGFLLFKRKGI